MLPRNKLIPTSGVYCTSLSAHNVVGNIRDLKHMASSESPKRPAIDRRWHPSRGIAFNTPSSDRSWRPSQDTVYSNINRSHRAPAVSKATVPQVEARVSEKYGQAKEERLSRPLPRTAEKAVATQSRTLTPDIHGEMLTDKRLVTIVPFNQRAKQPNNPTQKGSNKTKDYVENRTFDQSLIPQFDEAEVYPLPLLLRPTWSSTAEGFPPNTLIDQEVPISKSNHIELFQGLDHENGSSEFGCSLVAPSASSVGRLGISTTNPLGHQPMSVVGVSDVPKQVYPLSEVRSQPLEALNALASTDPVNVREETGQLENVDASEISLHGPLDFQIPEANLREIRQDSLRGTKTFWQYRLYRGPGSQQVKVHYCLNKEASESVARLFLDQEVVGFDIEWNQFASTNDGIRENVALVQLASEERIALFHIARYSAGDAPEDLVAPSLQKIMESPDITKVGVGIKADCTRLRRHMRIDSRGLLELSHLYRLVKYSTGDIKNINKKLVKLAQQVEEHLELPLEKGEVRCSDWTEKLDYKQIEYAASDSYAGLQLFFALEGKRKGLSPSPPRPRHAELNLPIQLANNETISTDDEPLEVSDEGLSTPSSGISASIEELSRELLRVAINDSVASEPVLITPKTVQRQTSEPCPAYTAANDWIMQWRATLPPTYTVRAMPAQLRAYALWHEQRLDVNSVAWILRDPPLKDATVATYILESLIRERLPFQPERIKEVLERMYPPARPRYYYFFRRIGIDVEDYI